MPNVTAEQIRKAMALEPEFLQLADLLREHFDAKLVWLKTPTLEIGKPIVGAVRAI